MIQLEPKHYNFSNVKFLSPSQLSQHYQLYTNYIKCYNNAISSLETSNIYDICNTNYCDIRCSEKSQTYCLDGIKLHELYFENLTGNNTEIYGNIKKIISDRFGSYDNFKDKFKCIGEAMRGWVIFCYDMDNNDYYIYGQDSHDNGVILCAKPLIVLDVYEHAYMIDYGIHRDMYIDVFFDNLDFNIVNRRLI